MRLIDADPLKDELNAWARVIMKPTLMGSDEVMCVIDHAPTIDAAPVVHGKWITVGKSLCSCSVCGDYVDDALYRGYKYCPNCGAKMRGEDDE